MLLSFFYIVFDVADIDGFSPHLHSLLGRYGFRNDNPQDDIYDDGGTVCKHQQDENEPYDNRTDA